jgi:hypothetical protein
MAPTPFEIRRGEKFSLEEIGRPEKPLPIASKIDTVRDRLRTVRPGNCPILRERPLLSPEKPIRNPHAHV